MAFTSLRRQYSTGGEGRTSTKCERRGRIIFRIKALRTERGLTQSQLAHMLGLKSQSTVAMWEKEIRRPHSTILPALADALGCTIDELYDRGDVAVHDSA